MALERMVGSVAQGETRVVGMGRVEADIRGRTGVVSRVVGMGRVEADIRGRTGVVSRVVGMGRVEADIRGRTRVVFQTRGRMRAGMEEWLVEARRRGALLAQ